MPKKGENIYKRKDGRWEGRYIKSHTFGYYNPSVEVTFTAKDVTSGVDYFMWSYLKEE